MRSDIPFIKPILIDWLLGWTVDAEETVQECRIKMLNRIIIITIIIKTIKDVYVIYSTHCAFINIHEWLVMTVKPLLTGSVNDINTKQSPYHKTLDSFMFNHRPDQKRH